MKAGEESTQAKTSKSATSALEAPTIPSYPDWTHPMQAYYGAGATPPPFFASTIPSPTPHPYMWGGQHALMPPYGTPVPYPAMYPPGGVYAHPNMAQQVPNTLHTQVDHDVKAPNGKEKTSARKTKGSGSLLGKVMENGKAASGSGNDGVSQSAESGGSGSSDASDENSNEQERAATKNGQFKQMLVDAASAKSRSNPSGAAAMPEQWMHDERELKRQKRKQSNRESARRSRLRKQLVLAKRMGQGGDPAVTANNFSTSNGAYSATECEELQTRVQSLNDENRDLRDELKKLSEGYEKLKSENDSIKEELTRIHGPDAVAGLELGNPSLVLQSGNAEGNS